MNSRREWLEVCETCGQFFDRARGRRISGIVIDDWRGKRIHKGQPTADLSSPRHPRHDTTLLHQTHAHQTVMIRDARKMFVPRSLQLDGARLEIVDLDALESMILDSNEADCREIGQRALDAAQLVVSTRLPWWMAWLSVNNWTTEDIVSGKVCARELYARRRLEK